MLTLRSALIEVVLALVSARVLSIEQAAVVLLLAAHSAVVVLALASDVLVVEIALAAVETAEDFVTSWVRLVVVTALEQSKKERKLKEKFTEDLCRRLHWCHIWRNIDLRRWLRHCSLQGNSVFGKNVSMEQGALKCCGGSMPCAYVCVVVGARAQAVSRAYACVRRGKCEGERHRALLCARGAVCATHVVRLCAPPQCV